MAKSQSFANQKEMYDLKERDDNLTALLRRPSRFLVALLLMLTLVAVCTLVPTTMSASADVSSVPNLIKALSDPIWTVRRDAAKALGDVSSMYNEAVAGLMNALTDPIAKVRISAAQSLGKLGIRDLAALPALESIAVEDSDTESRIAAIRALGQMGEGAAPILGRILLRISPRDEIVVETTLETLVAMGPAARPAMDSLGTFGRDADDYRDNDKLISLTTDALVNIGPEAVGQLIAIVDQCRWTSTLLTAVEAIGRLGPEVAEVAPYLVQRFDKYTWTEGSNIVLRLSASLYSMGSGAFPALIEGLVDDSWEVRAGCASVLARFGSQVPSSAIPALAELTLDTSDDCRAAAARALGSMGSTAAPAASALVELLSDDDTWSEALRALEAIGSPAIGPIRTGISHDDVRVRCACGQLLWMIEENPEGMPQTKEGLTLDRERRLSALSVLASMGPAAASAKSELRDVLANPRVWEEERMLAAETLESIGEPAARELAVGLADDSNDVRRVAERSLRRMGASALPALVEFMALSDDSWAIEKAGAIIDEIKKDERTAAVMLTQLATKGIPDADDHTQYMVRGVSMSILASLKTQSSSTIRLLTGMFGDPDHRIRAAAAFAVGLVGSSAQDAVGPLSKLIADNDLRVCTGAAEALASINTKSVRQLIDLLKSKSYDERRMAAAILWQLEEDAEPAIPALITALGDKSSYRLRSLAAKALGAIGSDASNVMTALEQALKDSHPEVRQSAQESINSIKKPNWWW